MIVSRFSALLFIHSVYSRYCYSRFFMRNLITSLCHYMTNYSFHHDKSVLKKNFYSSWIFIFKRIITNKWKKNIWKCCVGALRYRCTTIKSASDYRNCFYNLFTVVHFLRWWIYPSSLFFNTPNRQSYALRAEKLALTYRDWIYR